jgi:polar amino acid transport system permease protein
MESIVFEPPASQDRASEKLSIRRRRPLLPWIIFGFAIIVVFAIVQALVLAPTISWAVVGTYLFAPPVITGLRTTIVLSVISMAIGIVLGTFIGLARMSKNRLLSSMAHGYIMLFRGIPVLVQLLIWGNIGLIVKNITFGIPLTSIEFFSMSTNQLINPFTAAVVGLALHEAAYVSEIVRSGILSVDRGQLEAASALGMTPARTTRRIILPQALRVMIPPTGNQFVTLIKGTSLVSVIAGGDLLTQTQNIAATSYRVIEMLAVASFWYLILVGIATQAQSLLEKRVSKGVRA